MDSLLAQRTKAMGASAIREILKVVGEPDMISLAGGIPSAESFPMDCISDLMGSVLSKYSSNAFQYDLTEGFIPLRKALSSHFEKKGMHFPFESICISSGSQGVLDGLGKILISEGDLVAVEAPTYLGALQAFNPYYPRYVRIETDEDGVIPESLEAILKKHKIKFVYLIPNFQNPSGRTLSLNRRKKVVELAREHNILIIEDDPYNALRYQGEALPSIKSIAPDNVVYIGSLSKVFAPGLRVGYYIAPEPIQRWLVIAKQGVDLHTSTLSQALAAEYLTSGYLEKQVRKIVDLYRPKLTYILDALQNNLPSTFTWSRPEGGMFVWVVGPQGLNTEELYWKALKNKVAFVPGRYFFTEPGEGLETMRLNFTMANKAEIELAVERLVMTLAS